MKKTKGTYMWVMQSTRENIKHFAKFKNKTMKEYAKEKLKK